MKEIDWANKRFVGGLYRWFHHKFKGVSWILLELRGRDRAVKHKWARLDHNRSSASLLNEEYYVDPDRVYLTNPSRFPKAYYVEGNPAPVLFDSISDVDLTAKEVSMMVKHARKEKTWEGESKLPMASIIGVCALILVVALIVYLLIAGGVSLV